MGANGTQGQAPAAPTTTHVPDGMASIIDAAIERSEARWRAQEAARQPKMQLGEVLQLAQTISGSPTLPDWIRKPGDVVAVVLRGQELGIPPMSALTMLHMIKGKTVLDATIMRGLLLARGFKLRWGKCDDKIATLHVTRPEKGSEPETFTFTIEEAQKAKLVKADSNWQTYTADMLVARVSSRAARRVGGDVLAGCYIAEEIDDDAPQTAQRADATARVLSAPVALPSKTPAVYQLAEMVAGLEKPEDVQAWWTIHKHEIDGLASADQRQVKLAIKAACKRTGLDPSALAAKPNGNGAAKAAPDPVPFSHGPSTGEVAEEDLPPLDAEPGSAG